MMRAVTRGVAGICLVVFVTITHTAQAGINVWTSHGPYGADVLALAIDPVTPSTLYAGTDSGGVVKSIDAGGTWSAANTGLPEGTPVTALAIDPLTPTTLYAGIVGGAVYGVFKSTDAGGTWSATNTGPSPIFVTVLAIDPATPTTLYAGTSGFGVFKSTDAGASWSAANMGLSLIVNVTVLAIDPATPTTLYAGTSGFGVFKSTDAGASWSAANAGLPPFGPPGVTNIFVYTLAIDPVTPTTLYAGTQTNVGYGVFKSTDAGASWSAASGGLPGGTTVTALAIDPATPTTLYGVTRGSVFKSTDAGGTWSAANTGLPEGTTVTVLTIDPVTPGALYAGTSLGVFKSTDAGGTWSAASAGLLSNTVVYTLAIDPATPATLYAGTSGFGVLKSTDAGSTWRVFGTGLTGGMIDVNLIDVTALAIDPIRPTTLYAGTQTNVGTGVFKTTDAGGTWSAANTGLPDGPTVTVLAIDPVTPTTLYAGTSGFGVFKSTDAGGTWSVTGTGVLSNTVVYALAIDPHTPTTLYAGTCQLRMNGCISFAVSKSLDGGVTWTDTSLDVSVNSLVIDPLTPSTLYAATNGGVFKSVDAGATWGATGLLTNSVDHLAIDPLMPSTLYAGTAGGVFKSTDAGATWNGLNAGLTTTIVTALAIDPITPSTLYAVTSSGVFSIEQVEVSPTPSATATATATPTRTRTPRQPLTSTPTTTRTTGGGGGGCAIEPTGRGSGGWWVFVCALVFKRRRTLRMSRSATGPASRKFADRRMLVRPTGTWARRMSWRKVECMTHEQMVDRQHRRTGRFERAFAVGILLLMLTGLAREVAAQGDDLTVSSNVTLAEGNHEYANVTVSNGAVLTLGGGSVLNASGTLQVTDNSMIVVQGKNTDGTSQGVGGTINAGSVIVEAGSAISADGQGYIGNAGPGAGASNPSCNCCTAGAGGGYGGAGGDGTGTAGGTPYGLATEPTDLGSGGGNNLGAGCNLTSTVNAGGGAIRLTVAATLQLDGRITANGAGNLPERLGGGSGGSLYVTTGTLTGSGFFAANGADGGISNAGGGGGGRIAVYYADGGGFTGFTKSTANGGSGLTPGQTGTVGFFDTASTGTLLSVYQRFVFGRDSSIQYGGITLDNGATLEVGGGSTIQLIQHFGSNSGPGPLFVKGQSTLLLQGKNTTAQVNGEWQGVGVTINGDPHEAQDLYVSYTFSISHQDAHSQDSGRAPPALLETLPASGSGAVERHLRGWPATAAPAARLRRQMKRTSDDKLGFKVRIESIQY